MKQEDFAKALSELDEATVEAALAPEKKTISRRQWRTVGIVAACLCLVLAGLPILGQLTKTPPVGTEPGEPENEPPCYLDTFGFSTYEELREFLQGEQAMDSYNEEYGVSYERLLKAFAAGSTALKVPAFSGATPKLKGAADWQKIALFVQEMYGLPWIWYYCEAERGSIVVGVSDLVCLDLQEEPKTVKEVLSSIAPTVPFPENKEQFNGYTDIRYETLTLGEGTAEALVLAFKDGRIHYRFLLDGCLLSVWYYGGGEIDAEFWKNFSLKAI